MKTRSLGLLLFLTSLALLAGCGKKESDSHEHLHGHEDAAQQDSSDARKVTVVATDFAFAPASIEGYSNEKILLELINRGDEQHMWQIKGVPETHVHTLVGATSSKVIRLPKEPGIYEFACELPNHQEQGMKGSTTVVDREL